MTKSNATGWTLVEMLVAIAIASVMALVAIPKLPPFLEALKLRTAARNIERSLMAARTRAIADPNIHCGVVFKDSTTAIIYPDSSGTPYVVNVLDTASKYLGMYKMPKNIFFHSLSTDPITNNCIVFRGDGSAKYGGSVYVVNRFNNKRTVSVLATTGRIKVQ